jgi:hypothetical protein
MVEATRLKIPASRSYSIALPPYTFLSKSTNRFKSYYRETQRERHTGREAGDLTRLLFIYGKQAKTMHAICYHSWTSRTIPLEKIKQTPVFQQLTLLSITPGSNSSPICCLSRRIAN